MPSLRKTVNLAPLTRPSIACEAKPPVACGLPSLWCAMLFIAAITCSILCPAPASAGFDYITYWDHYDTTGANATFNRPSDVGFLKSNGNLLIVSSNSGLTGGGEVVVQEPNGTYVTMVAAVTGQGPVRATTDPASGDVYLGTYYEHKVHRFTEAGGGLTLTDTWSGCTANGGFGPYTWVRTFGVAVDSTGALYVSDIDNLRILKMNSGGQCLAAPLTTYTKAGAPGQVFSSPTGLAVDSADNLWVADSAKKVLVKFDSAGVWQQTLTGFSNCGVTTSFIGPRDVKIDTATNDMFITEGGGANPGVIKLDANGNFLTKASKYNGNTSFSSPFGTGFSNGYVYAMDYGHNAVVKLQNPSRKVAVTASAGGTVSADIGGVITGATGGNTCTDQFVDSSTVVLTATPSSGYLVTWGGADGAACTGNTCTLSNVAANKVVTATFVQANHTVTFNANGGSGSMSAQTTYVSTPLTANNFTRTGYSFAGWNTVALGGGTAYSDAAAYAFTADATLYAQWTALPNHTATFNANGGSGSMSAQTTNVSTPLTTNSFTRTGYSFAGWDTVALGGGTAYSDAAAYAFAADVTLYAQWTALPNHTATFNANGGGGSMSAQTTNVSTPLTANSFTRTGYSFAGWNTVALGGGTAYSDAAAYAFTADVTLYAQWTALPNHTATFNANGGSGSMSPQTTNVSTPLTANSFTRTGYTFAGWDTVALGGGTAYSDAAAYAFTADATLYAQWTALPNHTATFNANGGGGSMSAQTTNVSTPLTANSFTRTGYSFAGWNTVALGGGTAYGDAAAYAFTADVTLYAQWTAVAIPAASDQSIGTITFSPAALAIGGTSTVSATATSGLPVTFASAVATVCTVSGTTVTGVSIGTCTITASQSGNSSYNAAATISQNMTVGYNNAPPTLAVSALSDGATTTDTTQNISGTATDSNGIKTITVNGTGVTVNTDGSFSYPVQLLVGANTITVIVTNNADNTTTDSRTITLDSTAPKLTVSYPPDNGVAFKKSITVTGTIADIFTSVATGKTAAKTVALDPTMSISYTVNGSSAQTASLTDTTYTFTTNLDDGMNTIRVSAVNGAGKKVEAKRTVSYQLPTFSLDISDPASDIRLALGSYLLRGTVKDNSTEVAVTITMDGQSYTPTVTDGAFQQQLSFPADKTYQIDVTGIDQSNNSLTVQRNIIHSVPQAADGTIGSAPLTIVDALLALQMAVGTVTPTSAQILRMDTAPMVNGVSAGDGKIDIEDALVILYMAIGLIP
jgi:uncharacterized repeat protein (TIGR02543 family)